MGKHYYLHVASVSRDAVAPLPTNPSAAKQEMGVLSVPLNSPRQDGGWLEGAAIPIVHVFRGGVCRGVDVAPERLRADSSGIVESAGHRTTNSRTRLFRRIGRNP